MFFLLSSTSTLASLHNVILTSSPLLTFFLFTCSSPFLVFLPLPFFMCMWALSLLCYVILFFPPRPTFLVFSLSYWAFLSSYKPFLRPLSRLISASFSLALPFLLFRLPLPYYPFLFPSSFFLPSSFNSSISLPHPTTFFPPLPFPAFISLYSSINSLQLLTSPFHLLPSLHSLELLSYHCLTFFFSSGYWRWRLGEKSGRGK